MVEEARKSRQYKAGNVNKRRATGSAYRRAKLSQGTIDPRPAPSWLAGLLTHAYTKLPGTQFCAITIAMLYYTINIT